MLNIDGSTMEGGGQIVRISVALSAVTGTPVRIDRIRGGRERPGLAPQHCSAVKAVAGLCGATVQGCSPGSRVLEFTPGEQVYRDQEVDIGTAGSIPLVLQAWLPVALCHGASLLIRGGTEVQKSPTIDYFSRVFLPVIRRCGGDVGVDIQQRGYYPAGGGTVRIVVRQSAMSALELPPNSQGGLSPAHPIFPNMWLPGRRHPLQIALPVTPGLSTRSRSIEGAVPRQEHHAQSGMDQRAAWRWGGGGCLPGRWGMPLQMPL